MSKTQSAPTIFAHISWMLVALSAGSKTFSQSPSFERPPIDYHNAETLDPISQLAVKVQAGDVELQHEKGFGYLRSLLKALDVPLSSQTLVFSKTSLQLQRISPRTPRALYFSDDVYIGFCLDGDVLELAATGPRQGATFYTMSQQKQEQPAFIRDRGNCLACHATGRTQNVPGYLMRSVFPDERGQPRYGRGTHLTDSTSPFQERWGGWYVTGTHGNMRHMGNSTCNDDTTAFDRETGANCNALDRFITTGQFLSPHSDIVALMVLQHQSQMHNAIAAANYETRQAVHQAKQMNELLERAPDHLSETARRRINTAAERVLQHLLMCDEFKLTDRIIGSSQFTAHFEKIGKRDQRRRSLRDFDLQTRLFRYPCSYLIHSDAFDGLPMLVRTKILQKLVAVLTGEDTREAYQHLSSETRKAMLEILRDTKPEFRKVERSRNTN
ncbi:MAG: hypothetical protein CMN75_00160 [Spirochaeta sp.]|nr:hypothetical protein [Spirochaeta sp.]